MKTTPEQTRRLIVLLEKWARLNVLSRTAPIDMKAATDYYGDKLVTEDRMLRIMYGTSDLYTIAKKMGLDTNAKRGRR